MAATTKSFAPTSRLVVVFVVGALLPGYAVDGQQSFKCPHEYGFYPHDNFCDKYWRCENNEAELKTCGDGLAFDASDPKYLTENCDYLHNVQCGHRNQLQEPKGTSAQCPRLYGIFADESRCDTFYSCWAGESSRYTCAPGLAYDAQARVCMWQDQVPECSNPQDEGGFTCPDPKLNPTPGTFSRHAHPTDCRKYFVCLDGNPREYGCPIGTVFKIGQDDYSGQCEDPEGVTGCENYYGDELKGLKKSQLLNGDYYGRLNKNNNNHGNNDQDNRPARKRLTVNNSKQLAQQQEKQEKKQPSQQQPSRVFLRQQQQQSRPTSPPPPSAVQQSKRPTPAASPQQQASTAAPLSDDYYYYDDAYDIQQ